MEKIITLVIILILFFHLTYMKYKKEHFNIIDDNIKIYFDINKNMLWNNKNFGNINYNFENITFNKSSNIYYSNQRIFNELSDFNGLIFQPGKNIKNFTIGFHNIDLKDLENIELDNLDFSIKLLGNNILQIVENKEIINIDYCVVGGCNNTTDKYQYDDNNYLGLNIINSKFNFFIIKKFQNNYTGLRLHRSKNLVNFPIFACIINNVNKNNIKNTNWTSSQISQAPSPWSVEYISKLRYDRRELPSQIPLDIETETPVESPVEAPADEPLYPFEKVIVITEATLQNNINLIINSKVYNITQEYLDDLHEVNVKLSLMDKEDLGLVIPIRNDLYIFNETENRLNDIQVNLEQYKNYFYKKDFTAEIILRRSRSMSEKFNIVSKKFKVIKV